MPEGQSEESFCNLKITLFRYNVVDTTYDSKGGITRKLVLSGRVDDPYPGPLGNTSTIGETGSAFHNKHVRLKISSPPNQEWLREICADYSIDETWA